MQMRHLINLLEMPIDVKVIGVNHPGSFRADDLALATNPKAREKIARIWHTSRADVDLYLINNDLEYGHGDHRLFLLGKGVNNAAVLPKSALRPLGIATRPDAITVILTQNEGDQRMPLTGWMIAHRLWHALEEPARKVRNWADPKQLPKYPRLAKPVREIRSFMPEAMHLAGRAFPRGPILRSDLFAIGTTRACRTKNLASFGEVIPECFAQYLLSGKVLLKPLPAPDQFDPKFGVNAEALNELNDFITASQGMLMHQFQTLIDYAKGKAFRL